MRKGSFEDEIAMEMASCINLWNSCPITLEIFYQKGEQL